MAIDNVSGPYQRVAALAAYLEAYNFGFFVLLLYRCMRALPDVDVTLIH